MYIFSIILILICNMPVTHVILILDVTPGMPSFNHRTAALGEASQGAGRAMGFSGGNEDLKIEKP